MFLTESKNCVRRWWHGPVSFFLPQGEVCFPILWCSCVLYGVDASSFSHLCQQPQSFEQDFRRPHLSHSSASLKILLGKEESHQGVSQSHFGSWEGSRCPLCLSLWISVSQMVAVVCSIVAWLCWKSSVMNYTEDVLK